ncbi:MAG TPA: hypothetical protein DIT64_01815 [Verrucomicrobiales bacterium]|nr:hypothetical protein [Verrucomicrobiales bacterium]
MLHNIFEVGRIRDQRSLPAQALVPRSTLDIPKGTTFWIDEDVFQEALASRTVQGRKDADMIALINMNGVETMFSVFELQQRLSRTTNIEWEKWATDKNLARLELVAGMYMRRYPYEDTEDKHQG